MSVHLSAHQTGTSLHERLLLGLLRRYQGSLRTVHTVHVLCPWCLQGCAQVRQHSIAGEHGLCFTPRMCVSSPRWCVLGLLSGNCSWTDA